MKVEGSIPHVPTGATSPGREPTARTPEEAARQFEEILVRQFVRTMTDGLFQTGLAGEEGPGWMEAHRASQKDIMTDVLAKHLVETEALGISKLLLNQWQRTGRTSEQGTGQEEETP